MGEHPCLYCFVVGIYVQDALYADHLKVAVLLRAHGGVLGPSGDPSLLEKLEAPNVPSVYDVKKLVNKLMRQQVLQPS
jgi:hypothetical protein